MGVRVEFFIFRENLRLINCRFKVIVKAQLRNTRGLLLTCEAVPAEAAFHRNAAAGG